MELDRRSFLACAGAAFTQMLGICTIDALMRTDTLLASAYKTPSGTYGVALLSAGGDVLRTIPLPARGHDTIWHPSGDSLIVFARRPGTFALAIDRQDRVAPHMITAPVDRHFYGHGCFSRDGHLLYVTENDFEQARGVVGIYDARSNYQRIGEFESFGIGPHDMLTLPGSHVLVVANGGIETHPDYPRAKLNLSTMLPNLSLIDTRSGALIHQVMLPEALHKLSIRHLAIGKESDIWFACQNEGDIATPVPLFGKVTADGQVKLAQLLLDQLASLRGYIGSIAYNGATESVAVTSPRGGVMMVMPDKANADVITMFEPDVCGVVGNGREFVRSSGQGMLAAKGHALQWDNHLTLG